MEHDLLDENQWHAERHLSGGRGAGTKIYLQATKLPRITDKQRSITDKR